ncbi:MAG: DUF1737 domain-containing protein [Pseudomonadota bacterium]
MKIYRFLSAEDTSAFCHKMSAALATGWELYGSPTQTFDPVSKTMRCGQAVVKESDTPYHADMKLGEQ